MLPTTKILCVLAASLLLTHVALAASDSTCVGDCNDNNVVTVEEILTMANIALGAASIDACAAGDADHNNQITIDEILTAVHNALTSCPAPVATDTPTALATETPTPVATEPPTAAPTATPTLGGTSIAAAVAGRIPIIVDAMRLISDAVTAAIVNGVQSSGGSSALVYGAASIPGDGPCPAGGTATRMVGSSAYNLDMCAVQTFDGTATFDGSFQVDLSSSSFSLSVTTTFMDHNNMITEIATAQIGGSINPTTGGSCYITGATLTLSNGTLNVTQPATNTTFGLTFNDTTAVINNITFDQQECVPTIYNLSFTGDVGLIDTHGGFSDLQLDPLNPLVMQVDSSGDPALFKLSGAINTPCFGGSVGLLTDPPLSVPSGQNCPIAGTVTVTLPTQVQAYIVFQSDQSVDIDDDGNGTTDLMVLSCLDESLLMCVP